MSEPTLFLFFDGGCHLCSREIDYYRRRIVGPVEFIDIADPAFDAGRHGLDSKRIHKVMHVKVGDEVRTEVAAFAAIWERVPGQRWMAKLSRWSGVRALMTLGYHAFAAVRPLLPRRKASCATGSCRR